MRSGSFSSMRRVGDSATEVDLEGNTKSKFASDGDDGHWLLTGRPAFVNTLSSRQMKTLTAICDTLLPSISVSATGRRGDNHHHHHHHHQDNDDSILQAYFSTSASMTLTPQHVGGLVSGGMEHPSIWQLRLVLWLLSTWFGTFLVCGPASVSPKFPYLRTFTNLQPQRREKVLLSWSLSPSLPHNKLFKAFKLLTLLSFFSQVDDNNKNPTWKAIDYCGADPDFINQRKQMRAAGKAAKEEREEEAENRFGPLYRGLVDMGHPRGVILETLEKAGFPVSIGRRKGLKKHNKSSPLTIRCDAVVVGSGSGGGVVAGVLAKSGYKVLVLDKGNYFARCNLSLLEGPSATEMYEGGGLVASNNLGTIFLAGSTVGGGSAINWSASIRTPAHVADEWCNTYQLELFGSKAYKQALDAVCKKMGVHSDIDKEGFNSAVLRRGCHELGYPVCDIPRNSTPDHYCGWCHLGCKDGKKKGTHETWLVDLVESGNGVILPGCTAVKVLKEKNNGRCVATGIIFEHQSGRGGLKEVYMVESKVTVVACGALRTPSLLKRSGLKNPNIGRNLHIHPTIMAWGYFPENSSTDTWLEPEKKSYEGGIMTAMSTVVANFKTSGYGAVIQTPALHPGMFSALTPWISGLDIRERMSRFSRTAHIFALARDKGTGKVVNYPKSLSYKLEELDERNLQKALEKILRLLAAAGAHEIGTQHRKGERLNVKEASSHEFERFVKVASRRRLRNLSTPICSAHQMGSCRMGVDPKQSVVNERGETWEVEGLFLADTSVFPTALGVNPMVTVQAIAYCTAQSIAEVLARKKTGL
ncbi:hypothetical protein MRB53_019369 [Persea americana]|uniref:Uncharacterized protein n=1 Tax=Persea americana TaxID=3435 RepID=A0ACC2KY79_PERAE|nr:hypothetical protein MRB53_019369 [Persea americana]